MTRRLKITLALAALLATAVVAAAWILSPPERENPVRAVSGAESIPVMDFSTRFPLDPLPPGWHHRTFWTRAAARFSFAEIDGVPALCFETADSASMLVRWTDIPLSAYPVLTWRWYIDQPIETSADERTRAGDDHPARLFIAFETPAGERRAMEIVWGNEVLREGDYKYIGGFPHYVAGGGGEPIGRWYRERVDLLEIYATIWPDGAPPRVTEISLFADSDETDSQSRAYYADIAMHRRKPEPAENTP